MNIFGLNSSLDSAPIVLIPIPWEVTTTYGSGTSRGPEIIDAASHQVDFWDSTFGNIVELKGAHMISEFGDIKSINSRLKPKAQKFIFNPEELDESEKQNILDEVNNASEAINDLVYLKSKQLIERGKIVGLVGGDHSAPLGHIRALSENFDRNFGILHFDAHADLRKGYQGFKYSHASIMYNVMTAPYAPKKLVQLGIRDFCEEELVRIQSSNGKIKTFFDDQLKEQVFSGTPWSKVVDQIINELPDQVYVSFDIDGLEPTLCPHTGTPVAGGLTFAETNLIFKKLSDAKKKIIGFDLCEVSNSTESENDWDANVGSRILFKLCSLALTTNS